MKLRRPAAAVCSWCGPLPAFIRQRRGADGRRYCERCLRDGRDVVARRLFAVEGLPPAERPGPVDPDRGAAR